MPTFSGLSRAAYCRRQLYYARRDDDRGPSPEAEARQALAFRYDELREADDATLADLPIECSPTAYREAIETLSTRADWEQLCEPVARDYHVEGKDCHGRIHKLLAGDPPMPTVISPGTPPEQGVWEPQSAERWRSPTPWRGSTSGRSPGRSSSIPLSGSSVRWS